MLDSFHRKISNGELNDTYLTKILGQNFEILATVLNPKTRNESFELGLFIKIDFNDVNSVERRAMLLTHPAELEPQDLSFCRTKSFQDLHL